MDVCTYKKLLYNGNITETNFQVCSWLVITCIYSQLIIHVQAQVNMCVYMSYIICICICICIYIYIGMCMFICIYIHTHI